VTVEYCGPSAIRSTIENARAEYFHRATHIYLKGAAYTDALVVDLCELNHLHSMRLDHTQITADGVARLKRALPDCKIDVWKN
jgi:hypothetical protein